jgi:hypothetical protein
MFLVIHPLYGQYKLITKTNLQTKDGENVISGTIQAGYVFRTWPDKEYFITQPGTLDVVVEVMPYVSIYQYGNMNDYKFIIEGFSEPVFCKKLSGKTAENSGVSMQELNNQMANGYIQKIARVRKSGHLYQKLIVKKNNRYYLLEIAGDRECTMGTMKFNERLVDWQSVPVRQSPSREEHSVFLMRIIAQSNSISDLESQLY